MFKKVLSWLLFVSLFGSVIVGLTQRDKLNKYLSKSMVKHTDYVNVVAGKAWVDSLYNYEKTKKNYEISLIEFGAKSCSACKRMVKVMDEIQANNPTRVNVVFMNILEKESQMLMRYFGIVAIPTQVLLDKNGNEIFRHTGFISTADLTKKINQK